MRLFLNAHGPAALAVPPLQRFDLAKHGRAARRSDCEKPLNGVGVAHLAGAAMPPAGEYDVDIIILMLERAEETIAAVDSALSQVGVSLHVFILDQGSKAAVRQRLAGHINGLSNATLLAAPANLGVAGGRNVLSELGHGRVIVALDNDAEFASVDTVARMTAALDAESRLAAIACRIVAHDGGRDDISSWGYPLSLLHCADACFDTVTYVGAGHALRRSAWEQAGGYDSKLFFAWEEFDFCLRSIALGWGIRYRGDIVIRHKVSGECRFTWSGDRWYYHVRNRLYIELKLGRHWLGMAPRVIGYLVKGLRNGLLPQTLHALAGVRAMAPSAPQRRMTAAGDAYLARNDRLHRGGLTGRILREALSRLSHAQGVGAGPDR